MSTPLQLLLVEDSARDAALLVRLLRQGCYELVYERVETAEGMAAALDRQDWDLIIADYSVPSFGAMAALALLRQRHSDLPLIIVSGTISDEAAVECMKHGATDYLLKDRLGRLGDAVQHALEEKRLRAEKRQGAQQIRFQAHLLEAVEHAVVATDLAGTITYWNHFAARLYGWPEAEVLGLNILDVTPASASVTQAAEILDGLRTGVSWSGEYLARRRDGSTFPAFATDSPIYDEQGALIGIVGVSIDITERKRAQEETERARVAAEELARLRSDLVAAVSHELRTPLTAIIGFSELLQARWLQLSEPKRLAKIGQIASAAKREYRLVADMLLLSSMDTDELTMDCWPVPLTPLLERAKAEVQGIYPGQQIELEGPAHLEVLVDADRTVQILANLLDNAAKYSPDGRPITVSRTRETGMVIVRIHDRGPGIPEQGHSHLFTRFGRVPGSRMRAGHVGVGLGLYLSRAMARAMGGDLDLEQTGPDGSIFRIQLPSVPDQAQGRAAPA